MTDRELMELLLQQVTGLNSKINSIEAAMATKADFAELQENMATKEELDRFALTNSSAIARIEADLQTIKADVKELLIESPLIKRAVLEVSDAVNRIEATLETHDHTLDLLSRRSIDQEATLKRIK